MASRGLITARRMLHAYADEQQAWKRDHAAAMECRDLEDALGFGNAMFDAIQQFRHRHSGQAASDGAGEIEELFRGWAKPCAWLRETIAAFSSKEYTVDGAERFVRNCETAEAFLRDAERAAANEARVGLRDVNLTPEEADQLDQILRDPNPDAPRPPYEPKSVPLADASVLKHGKARQ